MRDWIRNMNNKNLTDEEKANFTKRFDILWIWDAYYEREVLAKLLLISHTCVMLVEIGSVSIPITSN